MHLFASFYVKKKRTKLPKIKKAFSDSPFGVLTRSRAKEKADFCQCPTNVTESYDKFDHKISLEYTEPSSDPILDTDWLFKPAPQPFLPPEVDGSCLHSQEQNLSLDMSLTEQPADPGMEAAVGEF